MSPKSLETKENALCGGGGGAGRLFTPGMAAAENSKSVKVITRNIEHTEIEN